jgi:hypothetical protein
VVFTARRIHSAASLTLVLNVCGCQGSVTREAAPVANIDAGALDQDSSPTTPTAGGAESLTVTATQETTVTAPGVSATGVTDNSGEMVTTGETSDVAPVTSGGEAECNADSPGPRRRLLRLTEHQLLSSISDLLGEEFRVPVDFSDEQVVAGFELGAGVDTTLALHWWATADAAASQFEENSDVYLQRFADCTLEDEGEACVAGFIQNFGRRAYRRPLEDSEFEALQAFYDDSIADGNPPGESLSAVLRILLMSADFTHRVEVASPGKHEVDDYELATRLSFLLWGTIPDEELLDAAESGTLTEPDVLADQVDRMLGDAKAREAMREFGRQWLELEPQPLASLAPELLEFETASYEPSHASATFVTADTTTPVPLPITNAGVVTWNLDADSRPQGTDSFELEIYARSGGAIAKLMVDGVVIASNVDVAGEETITIQAPLAASEEPVLVQLDLTELETSTELELRVLRLKGHADPVELGVELLDQALTLVEEQAFEGTFAALLTSAEHPALGQFGALFRGHSSSGSDTAGKGLLALPALLMSHGGLYSGGTSPIKRGLWLMERILCMQPPPPLPQLPDYCLQECQSDSECPESERCLEGSCVSNNATPCSDDDSCSPVQVCVQEQCIPNPEFCIPPRLTSQTTREWWDSFGSQCHGCHESINGLGYALENYDGLGRFRTEEETAAGPKAINAKGQLVVDDATVTFDGARELTELVDEAALAANCFVDSAFTYAYSQVPTGHAGAECALQNLRSEFPTMQFRPADVFRAIALSEAFRMVDEDDGS